jgi:hypothetical protein
MSCLGSSGWAGEECYASGAFIGCGLADGLFEHPAERVTKLTPRPVPLQPSLPEWYACDDADAAGRFFHPVFHVHPYTRDC